MTIQSLFATRLYRSDLPAAKARPLNADLEAQCFAIARDDAAGQRWSADHGYAGYTSYASLDDLAWRAPAFADLQKLLDRHARQFVQALALDLQDRPLKLNSLWINILEPDGSHSGHIHPHSIVSGTYYVSVPKGAGALRFEDPRLPMMMAAPLRTADAPEDLRQFVTIVPRPGTVLMWESWLRHEVLRNQAEEERISVSFNYGW
jgi:uncharacterized protein (TIGR02466 family)